MRIRNGVDIFVGEKKRLLKNGSKTDPSFRLLVSHKSRISLADVAAATPRPARGHRPIRAHRGVPLVSVRTRPCSERMCKHARAFSIILFVNRTLNPLERIIKYTRQTATHTKTCLAHDVSVRAFDLSSSSPPL